MNKQFPWAILLSVVALILIAVGGAYALIRVIGDPPVVKISHAATSPAKSAPSLEPDVTEGPITDGYLVVHMRATAKMSAGSEETAFTSALENKGFSQECPGKVVTIDFRANSQGVASEEGDGAAEADTTICLPAKSTVAATPFAVELAAAQVEMDPEDKNQFPEAQIDARASSLFVQTGKAGYLLFTGAAIGQGCAEDCAPGLAAGLGVTRMSRSIAEDRFLFSIPGGEATSLNFTAAIPVMQ